MIELIIRIGFSLLIVLGLMWGLAKLARRPLGGRNGGAVSVLARQQLTRGSAVAVVRVADRALVLGVTENQISLLADADLDVIEAYQPERNVRREAVPLPDPSGVPPVVKTAGDRGWSGDGRLAGSLLSPGTWRQTVRFLRQGGKS